MPVDTDSQEWKSGGRDDPISVEISSLLSNNKEKAFSIQEIEEYLFDEYLHLFPNQLAGEGAIDGAKAARQSIIANILERRYWQARVSFQYIAGDGDADPGIYYTDDGVGINPIAELDELSDPNPDSPYGTLSSRFRQIEKDVDEEVSELEERISRMEYQIREELGMY